MSRPSTRSHPALTAAAVLAAAVALVPLAYLLLRTAEGGLDAWWEAVSRPRVARLAATSLGLTAVTTAACLAIGVAGAWLVTRSDLPGRRVWAVVLALPLAVPSYVAAFSWVSVADLLPGAGSGRFEGFWASALVLTLYTYPYVYLPVAAALARVDPSQEEVARSLGRGPWETLWSVTLPQVRPAIAGGGLLAALYVLADFGAVSILRLDTFTRAVFTALEVGFNRDLALALATVLVLLTVLILAAEALTRRAGARYSSGRTLRRARAVGLGPARWAALAGTALVCTAALGVPAASLARWLAAGTSAASAWGRLAEAVGGSLSLALLGAAVTLVLGLPIGIRAARRPGRLSDALERAAYLAHGLPGVVVGLALVFLGVTVLRPLYQTSWMVGLAYATLFLPLAVNAVRTAVAQSPPVLEEAARSLGVPPREVLRRVSLPLALPGLAAGAALVILTAMKELPATLLLRPTGTETLATRLWSATGVGRYAEAAPYAAVLVLLAAIPTWVLVRRTGILPAADEPAVLEADPEELAARDGALPGRRTPATAMTTGGATAPATASTASTAPTPPMAP